MKQIGFILLVVGILITAYTGFNYVTKEKVVDIGPLEITQDKKHAVAWSPIIGIAVIVLGGGLVLFGNKKS
ncbi:MAG: hypothetical protein KA479_05095 [Saprospiraceae bacterium]|jgi:uncharacterized membrane protein|nr:hypothetical protein [Saprospiraceae bacterium]